MRVLLSHPQEVYLILEITVAVVLARLWPFQAA
jgi:hypothetical protein